MSLLDKIQGWFKSTEITGEELTPDEPIYINKPFEYQYFPKPKDCHWDSRDQYEHGICIRHYRPFFIKSNNIDRRLNSIVEKWLRRHTRHIVRDPKILRFEHMNNYERTMGFRPTLLEQVIAFKSKYEAELFKETWNKFGENYFYYENNYNKIQEYIFLIHADDFGFFDPDLVLRKNNPNYGSYCIHNGMMLIGDYQDHLVPRTEIKRKLDNVIGLSNYVIEDVTDLEPYGFIKGPCEPRIYKKAIKFKEKKHAMSFKLLI